MNEPKIAIRSRDWDEVGRNWEALHAEAEALKTPLDSIDMEIPSTAKSKPGMSALGANIKRLKLEKAWTYDQLAENTGLEKSLIIGHVKHGRGCHPSTLQVYSKAFGVPVKELLEAPASSSK